MDATRGEFTGFVDTAVAFWQVALKRHRPT